MAKKDNNTSSDKVKQFVNTYVLIKFYQPTPPKKALTAFFLYKKDVYDSVKQANPDLKITEHTKIISEQWRNLDQKIKDKYLKKHEEAKVQYEKEKKAYEDKYGKISKKSKKNSKDDGSSDDDNKKKSKKSNKK